MTSFSKMVRESFSQPATAIKVSLIIKFRIFHGDDEKTIFVFCSCSKAPGELTILQSTMKRANEKETEKLSVGQKKCA